MRYTSVTLLLLFFCSCFYACNTDSKKNIRKELPGNWLIVYPEHRLETLKQREVYGKYQDSLVSILGLKLINFTSEGTFKEMDSVLLPAGRWLIEEDSLLKIREGGLGFNPFNATVLSYKTDSLRLLQTLLLGNEKIKLIWHLKKVTEDNEASILFSAAANHWRQKPAAPQTDEERRKKLADMLTYYGNYLGFLSKEASYFMPTRLPLPFQYYQHAMGMANNLKPEFKRFFYDYNEAGKAFKLLEKTLEDLSGDYPSDNNYVVEYGLFLKKMGKRLSE